jgi:hypothetical protein
MRYGTKLQEPDKTEEELFEISEIWTENFSHTALYIRVPPLKLRRAHNLNITFATESQISGSNFLYYLFAMPPNSVTSLSKATSTMKQVQSSPA